MKKIRLTDKDITWINDIMKTFEKEFGGKEETVFAEDDKGNRIIVQVLENKYYVELTLNKSFIKEEE